MKRLYGMAALFAAASAFGSPLITGGSMDLGDPGKPVPGWDMEIAKINYKDAVSNPEVLYCTETVPGKTGYALRTPAGNGIISFALRCGRFRIDRDAEVEVSFDCKFSPEEIGKISSHVDLRTLGDRGAKPMPDWDHPRYPVLQGIGIRPSAEWQHVSRKFKVRKWNNDYIVSIHVGRRDGSPLQGSMFLDNFKIRFTDAPALPVQEAAAIPDRDGAAYRKGEMIRIKLNALLDSAEPQTDAILTAVADHDSTVRKDFPVVLRKNGFRHTGTVEWKAGCYGSWHFELRHKGKNIPVLGDFSVIHAPVKHPAHTPGWGLGYNTNQPNAPRTPISRQYTQLTTWFYPSLRSKSEIPYLAGMRLARIWANWQLIEPEKGKFNPALTGLQIDEAVRSGMEPVFCIAGTGLLFSDGTRNPEHTRYPLYLQQYMKPVPGKNNTLLLDGPATLWDSYLDYCLKTWGAKVRFWEFLNEPGSPECKPEVYIRYLKHIYARIKAANPEYKVLANGNTCDVGFDKGWCARLSKADSGYVDFMDYCAFHPYWNSTDYIKGVFGLYSKHVQELRATMKKQKPLWNTECFYIINARKPQNDFYINLEYCDAEAVQRHYLDGMLNGVEAALALNENSFLKVAPRVTAIPALSEMATALNALSSHLSGMEKLEPLKINQFMRAGIFSGKNGKAVGFVYDLRPSGSTMNVPEKSGVVITDLFGNPEKGGKIKQSFEPHYIFGSASAVQAFFRNVRFIPAESCRVYVRKAGKTAHVNAVNMNGQAGFFTARFKPETKLPSVQFSFRSGSDESTADIYAPDALPSELPFHPDDNGSEPVNAIRLPDTLEYQIKNGEDSAETLRLKNASVKVWSEKGFLKIRADVNDPDVTASPDELPWNGDSVEVFLDPAPFNQLGNNVIMTSNPLNCYQFGFAALPSKTGHSAKAIARANGKFVSQSSVKQSRHEHGYTLEASIPWNEFRLPGSEWFGMEINIHREGTDKPAGPDSECLSGLPEKHYLHRFHYPVFRLAPEVLRELDGKSGPVNGDFREGRYGEAASWILSPQDFKNTIRFIEKSGFNGANAVVITAKDRSKRGLTIMQTLDVPPDATGVRLRALVKLENIDSGSEIVDRWRPRGFVLRLGDWDLGHTIVSGMPGDTPWTSLDCWIPMKKKAKTADLTLGLRGASGEVTVSNIKVEYAK